MEKSCILQGVPPVGTREASIGEYHLYLLEEHAVHAFCDAVMLRCVCSGHLMLDSFVLEVFLDFSCCILTPSIRLQDLQVFSHFKFSLGDKSPKVLSHF